MSAEGVAPEFVDTNVFVYAHDATAGKKGDRARALIETLWHEQRGCLSVQVLNEFFVTMTRKVPRPLDGREAARIVEHLAAWRVHAPGAHDVLASVELHLGARLSLWDAMVVQSAHQMRCHRLWSEDLSHGSVYKGVRVQNPFR